MPQQFGVIIVGDEILAGRREDKHLRFATQELSNRGLQLAWARYIGDDPAAQTALYRETLAGDCIVFSFGGIGATPDDHSRQAAAAAAGVPLVQHPEATSLITERFGEAAYPNRIRMAQLPDGCLLVPNPINQIAGFSLARHYFVPGFPEMAHPMVRWVLDQHYRHLGIAEERASLIVPDAKEGDLIDLMENLLARHPDIRLSCLPSYGNARHSGLHIEFTLSGRPGLAGPAAEWLSQALRTQGYQPGPVSLSQPPATA